MMFWISVGALALICLWALVYWAFAVTPACKQCRHPHRHGVGTT
jgi:hypothetical protein